MEGTALSTAGAGAMVEAVTVTPVCMVDPAALTAFASIPNPTAPATATAPHDSPISDQLIQFFISTYLYLVETPLWGSCQ